MQPVLQRGIKAAAIALRELRTVQAGGRGLAARDMAWTVP